MSQPAPRHARRRARNSPANAAPEAAGPVRLQKILAAAGVASRRGAEELLRQRRVTVNGRTAQLGDSAQPGVDEIAFDGESLAREPARYWLVHKPVGVLSTVIDPHGRRTVLDLLPEHTTRLYPVGRLDRESAGLVLLTNDGPLTQTLLHPSLRSEREYRVTVKGGPSEKTLARLARGVHLEDGRTAPALVKQVRYHAPSDTTTFALTLREGRKRQIRRAMLALGHPVKRLVRMRLGPLRLGKLEAGAVRPLRPDEIQALKTHAQRLVSSRRRSRRR